METARRTGAGGARFVVRFPASTREEELEAAAPAASAAALALLAPLTLAVLVGAGCASGPSARHASGPAQPGEEGERPILRAADCSAALRGGDPEAAVSCFDALETEEIGESASLELALALLHPGNRSPDWERAKELLRATARDGATGASSTEAPTAEVILSLQREIERLLGQLRKLRDLDLEGDGG